MNTLTADGWTIGVPPGWELAESADGIYLQSPDRTKGCHVIAAANPAWASARQVAEQMQSIVEQRAAGEWTVAARDSADRAGEVSLRLDLVDRDGQHCMLSRVFATRHHVLHLMLHDYLSGGYEPSLRALEPIALSVRRAGAEDLP